jgi:hypothetical protein
MRVHHKTSLPGPSALGRTLRPVAFLLAGAVASPGPLPARTIEVDCAGGGAYLTIQDGIDASSDGDTILVSPCRYPEAINYYGREIVVKSRQGPLVTTIQPPGGDVVKFGSFGGQEVDTTAVLEGFTIVGGHDGVHIGPDSHPKIVGNVIRNVSSGAFLFSGSKPIIRNNVIHTCGAGIYALSNPREVRNNIVFNFSGRGILLEGEGINCTVEENVFLGLNQGYPWPNYGINLRYGRPTIRNNVIIGDYATPYPIYHGIISSVGSDAVVRNNVVVGNGATGYYVGDRDPVIENNVFHGNPGKGLFFLRDYGNPRLSGNIITENGGYGIDCYTGFSGVMRYNDVWGNAGGDYSDSCVAGEGDISRDPLFVDAGRRHFSLSPLSPAVDAGDTSLLDTDGTRSDMGAYGGPWADPVNLSISTPTGFFAARGDTLHLDALVSNNTAVAQEVTFRVDLYVATGSPYAGNPITGPVPMSLGPGETLKPAPAYDYPVPTGISAGVYRLEGVVADSLGGEIDRDFLFLIVN